MASLSLSERACPRRRSRALAVDTMGRCVATASFDFAIATASLDFASTSFDLAMAKLYFISCDVNLFP